MRGLYRLEGHLKRLSSPLVRARQFTTTVSQPAIIHEVSPRDGLQNEKVFLSVDQKHELVQKLIRSNPNSIELTSFVRPDLIPAMAGGVELCERLGEDPLVQQAKERGMSFAALVPNMKGFETLNKIAQKSELLDTVVLLVSATESHSEANVRMPIKKALEVAVEIIKAAQQEGIKTQAYVSMAFGCPFEGKVDTNVVQSIVEAYVESGADVVMLADSLGVGVPEQVDDIVSKALQAIPLERLGMHLHDTSNTAQMNTFAAAKLGVRRFDSAVGGCGGCNFAPGAQGNISTQALLAVLKNLGIESSIDYPALIEANDYLQEALGRPLASNFGFSSG